jgi:hypothetical protein
MSHLTLRAACVLCCLAAYVQAAELGAATRPALNTIDLREYCTVLLAPKLQDKLGLTDDQRKQCAELKARFNGMLDNAVGNIHGPTLSAGILAGRTETVLKNIGEKVRDVLQPDQDRVYVALLADKTIKTITVRSAVGVTGHAVRHREIYGGIQLDFTHYGEQKDAVDETPLSTQPTQGVAPSKSTVRIHQTSGTAGSHDSAARLDKNVDVDAALRSLSSQAVPEQVRGAAKLAKADPDDSKRAAVRDALKPHLTESDAKRRLTFVQAYCNWATADDVDTLKNVLNTPAKLSGITGQEKPWAAAVTALVKLDPSAAADSINQRSDSLFFRTDVIHDLEPLTEVNGPISPVAQHFIDQLHNYRDGAQVSAK